MSKTTWYADRLHGRVHPTTGSLYFAVYSDPGHAYLTGYCAPDEFRRLCRRFGAGARLNVMQNAPTRDAVPAADAAPGV